MKKQKITLTLLITVLTAFSFFNANRVNAQNVGINTNTPDASALVDAYATDKGVLIPRLTTIERNDIPSPATGLIIYNTNSEKFNFWDGASWEEINDISVSSTIATGTNSDKGVSINATGNDPDPSAILDIKSDGTDKKGLLIPRTTTSSVSTPAEGLLIYNTGTNKFSFYDGTAWQSFCHEEVSITTGGGSFTSDGTGVNISSPDASAILEMSSTSRGFLIPRLTETERDNVISPANGLMVYNSTDKSIDVYTVGEWRQLTYEAPNVPTANAATGIQETQVTANWTASTGATYYELDVNTASDFSETWIHNGTDVGNVTSYDVSLDCETPYYYRVRACNGCGCSGNSSTITVTTSDCFICGTTDVTFTYNGSSVTYGTVENTTTGKCWLDRNLGASQVATAYNDYLAYGDHFQWGRLDDGHQVMLWTNSSYGTGTNTNTTLSTTDVPGHDDFITPGSTPFDWRSDNNDGRWNASPIVNNPCPSGFRLPTAGELELERDSWGSNDYNGAFGSPLKLPTAGYRLYTDGVEGQAGSEGHYWSSMPATDTGEQYKAQKLRFYGGGALVSTQGTLRANGHSVRCIKD